MKDKTTKMIPSFEQFKAIIVDMIVTGDIDKYVPRWNEDKECTALLCDEVGLARNWATNVLGYVDTNYTPTDYEISKIMDEKTFTKLFKSHSVWDEIERLKSSVPDDFRKELDKVDRASAFALGYTLYKCAEKHDAGTGGNRTIPLILKHRNIEKLIRKFCGDLLWFCFIDGHEVCGFRISYEEYLEKFAANTSEEEIAITYALLKDIEAGRTTLDDNDKTTVAGVGYLILEYCGVDVLRRVWDRLEKYCTVCEEETNED